MLNTIIPELREMFIGELEALIKRFSTVSNEEVEHIKMVFEIIERLDIKGGWTNKLEKVGELAGWIQKYGLEVVEFYLWWHDNISSSIQIDRAKDHMR